MPQNDDEKKRINQIKWSDRLNNILDEMARDDDATDREEGLSDQEQAEFKSNLKKVKGKKDGNGHSD